MSSNHKNPLVVTYNEGADTLTIDGTIYDGDFFRLLRVTARPQASETKKLSAREHQIVSGFLAGISQKEISITLGLSPKTVNTYLGSAKRKLGARSNADLVRRADRMGIAVCVYQC